MNRNGWAAWAGIYRLLNSAANALILTSPDGVTWAPQGTGLSGSLYDVIWTGSNYIAVGSGGNIYQSSDGMTWAAQTSGTTMHLYGVASSGAQIVAVGNGILTSP